MTRSEDDSMGSTIALRYVIAGTLKQETLLPFSRPPVLNQPGGSAMYASAGVSIWDHGIGLVAQVGKNYPVEWLDKIWGWGWDVSGVRTLSEERDHRSFFAYQDSDTICTGSPIDLFSSANLPFPKELIGYTNPAEALDSRTTPSSATLKASDIPGDYLEASAAHLCPLDYHSHVLIPPIFRQGHITTITLEPASSYMNPAFLDLFPSLLGGITAFLPTEQNALNLFRNRTTDLQEIVRNLSSFGCDIVVIQRGNKGCLVYDRSSNSSWLIPTYPSQTVDPTGATDAFCGGFLAGYRLTYDPLQAALHASIARSFCVESSGPRYLLDIMPGLAQARLESLRGLVRKT